MKSFIRIFLPLLLCVLFYTSASARDGLPDGYIRPVLQVQTASPSEPTAAAVLTFPDLPDNYFRTCSITWLRDGIPVESVQNFTMRRGAMAVCSFTTTFSADMPDTSIITAVIRWGDYEIRADGVMHMENYPPEHYQRMASLTYPYRIVINRDENIVLIYAIAEDGTYSLLQNAFLCSTGGERTPLGKYFVGHKLRWHTLFGSKEDDYRYVYGQYITAITGNILFHSVPYKMPVPDDLKTAQYNKLGESASLGCIRLSVEHAKWIYDNCPFGTAIEISNDAPIPVRRPAAVHIDPNSPMSGWDPTDPDPNNPWLHAEF